MLTIRRTRILRGPNIWAPVPVIVLDVEIGELEARLSRETPIFFERLIALVPSLRDSGDLVLQPQGGLRRLLLDRLALALQHLVRTRVDAMQWNRAVGAELTDAQTQPAEEPGLYRVVYAYDYAEVGVAAGSLAVRLLNHLVCDSEPDFAFASELANLVSLAKRHAYHWTTGAVVDAAERRGISVQRLSETPDMVQLGNGCYQRRILSGSITSETTLLADKIATDKGLTTRLLGEAGLPVPRNAVVHDADEAATAATAIGYPVVVKPLDASQGRGLTIDVRDEADVREVFPLAKQHSRNGQVIVERFIPGKYYRILVVGNQAVAVVEVSPAHVIGDGMHTIARLVEITNADPRRDDPDTLLKPITVDAHTHTVLAQQDLSLDDVPDAGRYVKLKQFGIYTLGGTYIDRTDEIHPDNVAIARQAAMVVGLDVAGIDLITPDIAHSAYAQGGAIIEVNQQPGLRVHIQPTEGQSRDVGMAIIDHLFPPGTPSRVPIVAVTGTNGKTTTTRMIAHILTMAGKTVGMATTDGITVAGLDIASGDMAGPPGALPVLRNPAIDAAVLETARGGILQLGLAFTECDVGVVTNIAGDHLGKHGLETLEDLARVKAVVPKAVAPAGASVLNADNPYTVAMAAAAGGEVMFFSMIEDSPVIDDHVRQGGRAVVLHQSPAGEELVLLAEQAETVLLPAQEIPATLDGRIRVNIANALAAAAAAIAQEVPLETLRTALRTFANDVVQSPGRFNLLQIDGRSVLIDYCHNLHGLEAMADFITRMDVAHTVAVIAIPGDRTDEHINAFGELAGRIFDELVILDTPAEYRRHRRPGEVPELLQAAAIAGGLPRERISHSDDEQVAARMAIAKGRQDGLVVMLTGSGRSLVRTERSRHLREGPT